MTQLCKSLVCVGVLLGCLGAAALSPWIEVYEDANYRVTVDANRMLVEDSTYRAWERWTFARPQQLASGQPFDHAVVQQRYNCLRGQHLPVTALYYHQTERVELKAFTTAAWRTPEPGTVGEQKVEQICRLFEEQQAGT